MVHFSKTSGARKPGLPALSAFPLHPVCPHLLHTGLNEIFLTVLLLFDDDNNNEFVLLLLN